MQQNDSTEVECCIFLTIHTIKMDNYKKNINATYKKSEAPQY